MPYKAENLDTLSQEQFFQNTTFLISVDAPLRLHILGGSNVKKWGDHQKKIFFISNAVEALIPFKEDH